MPDIALKDYIDQRFADTDRRITDRFEANRIAVLSAEAQMTKRLDGMNEFREALKDQAATMVTRIEFSKLENIVQEIRLKNENSAGQRTVLIAELAAGVGVVVWALNHFLK